MKILLIDDNRSLTTLLSRALSKLGYDPHTENSSLEALDTIKEILPDLVVLDLDMPMKSGIEIYGEMNLDPKISKIPVIMLAPLSNPGAVRAEAFGCDVISKPAKLDVLHETILKNLQGISTTREINPTPSINQKREIYENILQ